MRSGKKIRSLLGFHFATATLLSIAGSVILLGQNLELVEDTINRTNYTFLMFKA